VITFEEIQTLDAEDPLRAKRAEFCLPANTIYLDGNSLGPLPIKAKERISTVIDEQWGKDLIQSWNKNHWIDLPIITGDKIAPLIGAATGQVICCDSISINLFKLLASALTLNRERKVILSPADNFPTDLYMVQGLAKLVGNDRCHLKSAAPHQLLDMLDETVAGERYDIEKITQLAHTKGVLVIWDLAHSAGAFPLELDNHKVDFAVGCGYKYLNGGPGAPAFLYVAERHHSRIHQPLSGWMGHKSPFGFNPEYAAAPGIRKFLSGTPNILSLTALDAALDVFDGVDMRQVEAKSHALSSLFLELISQSKYLTPLECISPATCEARGSQLAFSHEDAYAISQALIDRQVVVDFRAPNIIRFGFTPLYLRYEDIWSAVNIFEKIIRQKLYQEPQYQIRNKVT